MEAAAEPGIDNSIKRKCIQEARAESVDDVEELMLLACFWKADDTHI